MKVHCKLCANVSCDESGREVKEDCRVEARLRLSLSLLLLTKGLLFPHSAPVLPASHLVGFRPVSKTYQHQFEFYSDPPRCPFQAQLGVIYEINERALRFII